MRDLDWTGGFCACPQCGRFIGHFRDLRSCPQCGAVPPKTGSPLKLSGIDYTVGYLLGVFTARRWALRNLLERFCWSFFGSSPRQSDEHWTVLFMLVSAVVYTLVAGSLVGPISVLGTPTLALLLYRAAEIIAVRARIVLYDRRVRTWRHATFTRSFLLLSVNAVEIIFTFGSLYAIAEPEHLSRKLDPLLVSASTFLLISAESVHACSRVVDVLRLCETAIAFILVGIALGALVGMMSEGKEAGDEQK